MDSIHILKPNKALNEIPVLELRSVTGLIGYTVLPLTCHPTQVNAPRLNPSQLLYCTALPFSGAVINSLCCAALSTERQPDVCLVG